MQTQLGREARHPRTETDLRQATLQRHLSALEANLVIATGTRFLPFLASTTGLALARRMTAATALTHFFCTLAG